jgi:pimeloyl-ACP methyl ester carboxylesterase
MAYAQLDGIRLYYESAGSGRPVVLVNSMGTTLRTWDGVTADLAADHRVISYDQAVPIAIARELAALTPGSTIAAVEGAGHMAHQEAPVEVAAAIRALVRLSSGERASS